MFHKCLSFSRGGGACMPNGACVAKVCMCGEGGACVAGGMCGKGEHA